jgi:uncharacterized membrane protein
VHGRLASRPSALWIHRLSVVTGWSPALLSVFTVLVVLQATVLSWMVP